MTGAAGPDHPGPESTRDFGREPSQREFGRDGVSGLVTADRALRARDVSRPNPADEQLARSVLDDLLARVNGGPYATRHHPSAKSRH